MNADLAKRVEAWENHEKWAESPRQARLIDALIPALREAG